MARTKKPTIDEQMVVNLRRVVAAVFQGYKLTRHERDEMAGYVKWAIARIEGAK